LCFLFTVFHFTLFFVSTKIFAPFSSVYWIGWCESLWFFGGPTCFHSLSSLVQLFELSDPLCSYSVLIACYTLIHLPSKSMGSTFPVICVYLHPLSIYVFIPGILFSNV